ncbi:halocyanin domain-containing protein [Salinigranum rubrum]|uniref:Halocyanin domain-containing protein n=1 Tax=Salinigranum rubrum TaxID=755307 RepID=A0A2I8VGV6_9EURY|nr:halocyanin domain-containing protein [Salinigranum rubrum]AUV81124.1 halocyanin domain-containing protein [Salinigranum rubrum]
MSGQTRRDVLRGGLAAGATALGAGAASTPAAAQGGDYDGWLSDVDNYDGTTEDLTGQESVEIEVGAQGNGGTFAFAPPAVRVSPGTTVTFNWTSNTHNVLLEEQPEASGWEGHAPIENTGFTLEHTFEVEGVYKYYCEPHLSLGMKGVVVVEESADGPVVEAEYGDWFADVDNFDGTTENLTGEESVEVEVGAQGNGGTFAFAPPAVRVSPGTTVTFNWTSNTHNVLVEQQPDGGGWEGHAPIENTGFTYEHTFETPGVYTYYCEPHLSLGMKGAVVVGAAPGGGAEGEGEASAGAIRLLQITQGLLSVVFLAILGVVAYVAINQNRYPTAEPDVPDREPVAEAAFEEPQVELEHDDFDPVGTFTVILGYFAILVLMWVFMYFVEFLGNGPTVVG